MRRAFSFLVLFVLPIFAVAQEPATPHGESRTPTKQRLKIGVALEGGGALGLAHIGVLQWFEEQHVPVDYVAGTSMGGLVGGFYATGVSPDEMKKLIEPPIVVAVVTLKSKTAVVNGGRASGFS